MGILPIVLGSIQFIKQKIHIINCKIDLTRVQTICIPFSYTYMV